MSCNCQEAASILARCRNGKIRPRKGKRRYPQATGVKRPRVDSYVKRLERLVAEPQAAPTSNAMKRMLETTKRIENNIDKYKNTALSSDAQAAKEEIEDLKKKMANIQKLKKARKMRMKNEMKDLKALTRKAAKKVDSLISKKS